MHKYFKNVVAFCNYNLVKKKRIAFLYLLHRSKKFLFAVNNLKNWSILFLFIHFILHRNANTNTTISMKLFFESIKIFFVTDNNLIFSMLCFDKFANLSSIFLIFFTRSKKISLKGNISNKILHTCPMKFLNL